MCSFLGSSKILVWEKVLKRKKKCPTHSLPLSYGIVSDLPFGNHKLCELCRNSSLKCYCSTSCAGGRYICFTVQYLKTHMDGKSINPPVD